MTTDEGMKFAFIIAATEESPYWDPMTEEAAEAIWDEWIARVKRDAAREALDGLAANMAQIANGSPDPLTRMSATTTARLVGEYKLNVYPEESP